MSLGGAQVAGAVGRVLPQDHEAEQSVLGALMLDQNAIAAVRDLLEPADFYEERHKFIFQAATALNDRGEPIDPLTLKAQLERYGLLSRSGGIDYLAELSMVTPTAALVKHYAELVIDRSVRRKLVAAGGEVTELGFDETLTLRAATDRAEQIVFKI